MKISTLSIAGLLSMLATSLACSPTPTTAVEKNRGSLLGADGTYTFVGGKGVGEFLRKGTDVPDNHSTPFVRLRAPASLMAAAMARSERIKTISLEEADPSIEITVRRFVNKTEGDYFVPNSTSAELETLTFHPGDAWISGYAQVGAGDDNVALGLFEVIKWKRAQTMPGAMAQEIYSTGLLPDEGKPALKYAENLTKVNLPANWK
jgi:hypothetical protein